TPTRRDAARTLASTRSSRGTKGYRPERRKCRTADAGRAGTSRPPRAAGRGRRPERESASTQAKFDSLPDVTLQHLTSHDGAVDVALRVNTEALGTGVIGARRLHVFDERGHRAIFRAANPDALLDPRQFMGAGIGP